MPGIIPIIRISFLCSENLLYLCNLKTQALNEKTRLYSFFAVDGWDGGSMPPDGRDRSGHGLDCPATGCVAHGGLPAVLLCRLDGAVRLGGHTGEARDVRCRDGCRHGLHEREHRWHRDGSGEGLHLAGAGRHGAGGDGGRLEAVVSDGSEGSTAQRGEPEGEDHRHHPTVGGGLLHGSDSVVDKDAEPRPEQAPDQ